MMFGVAFLLPVLKKHVLPCPLFFHTLSFVLLPHPFYFLEIHSISDGPFNDG